MDRFLNVRDKECFKALISELKDKYESFASSDTELTDKLFDIFYKTGSRIEYENVYFRKRGILTTSSILYFIYREKEYYNTMIDIMRSICEEKTWALPAHIPEDTEKPECVIDLFNAETAQALAEICCICDIPDELHKRVHKEIEKRIAIPFSKNLHHWESADHNWAAVCGGCVGMTLIYEFPKIFSENENRIKGIMNSYLSGFGNDGISPEGLGYWKYGFRYFTAFGELYKSRYGVDIMNSEKIKRIAQCQQYMIFENGVSVSFSDCSRNEKFDLPIAHFYRRVFGSDIDVPDNTLCGCMDNCNRYIGASRAFLWFDEENIGISDNEASEMYFEDVKWYISNGKTFSFAAKAGHNGESHNHNDIGGFIIASDGDQIIADYGAGEYTREYFSDKRYDFICNSSLGHSVPIIDGMAQSAGCDFKGNVIEHSDGVFAVDISGAYDSTSLKTLERKFEISDICVKIRDTYSFNDDKKHDITERFVSVIEPRIIGGNVIIGSAVLISEYMPELSSCRLKDHDGNEDIIYFIDYDNIKDSFELCIKKTP